VAHLLLRIAGLLLGGVLFLSAPVAAAPLTAHIRVEGAHKTLIPSKTVTLAAAPIVKDGDPSHSCPGTSALGALQAGSGGDWDGKWSDGLGYFISAIRGEHPAGSDYFALWIDHKESQVGICSAKVRRGDDVLLFEQHSTHPLAPLGIRVPVTARRGRLLTLTVVRYTPTGLVFPENGATVYANGRRLRSQTNRKGHLRLRATKVGKVVFFARRAGAVKSEPETTRIRRA